MTKANISRSPIVPTIKPKTAKKLTPFRYSCTTLKRRKGEEELYDLLHLGDIQLNMRVHFDKLVVRAVNLILDVLFQIRHLREYVSNSRHI